MTDKILAQPLRSIRATNYGLPPNEGTLTLEKRAWTPPEEIKVAGEDERALVHHGGERLEWQVVGQ